MYKLEVSLPNKCYDIFIEKGSFKNLGREIKKIYKNRKIAVITDDNLNRIYGKELVDNLEENGFNVKLISVKPGEGSKSLNVLERVYNQLLDFNITRADMIVAFGGGVVGDLSGFAAATLLRGIPFIQVPTSLLAQVDSSVGGKVAVNLEKGKNLVGNFYHPERVFIDPELLNTLPKRFLYDGMAEVIKYGAIKEKELFDDLMSYNKECDFMDKIEEIIYRCCNSKRTVVEGDEKDTGGRMILNFGHTIGHAVEKYFNYREYTHGEGVAVGMYSITKRSEEIGLTEKGTSEKIKEILIKYNLPYEIEGLHREELINTIAMDKKSKGDNINIILLRKIGECFINKIEKNKIKEYL